MAGRQAQPRASFPYAGQPRAVESSLSFPGLYEEGPPPRSAGGRRALAVGGGLRAFGWESAVPIRVNYRPGPDVRSVSRPGTSGTCE